MVSYNTIFATLSSTAIRVLSFVFLRWIPGHQLPPTIFALAAIYVYTYIVEFLSTTPYQVIEDDIVIVDRQLPPREAAALGVPPGSEEIDVEEVIIAEEKPPHVLSTLLSGLPSPTSLLASFLTLAINLALVGMVADLVWRGYLFYPSHDLKFARLGYVSESSARILVREPDVKELPIYLSVRYADVPAIAGPGAAGSYGLRATDDAWKAVGSAEWLTEDTDYTTTFDIEHLLPDTRYQYALSNNISGYFITAPSVGQISKRPENHHTFSFMHTSCVVPRFPYDPRDHPLNVPGFRHLKKWIGALRPAFMFFLGDFIYIDVPRRHGKDVETYRREYRQVYSSPDYPGVTSTKYSTTQGPDYDIPWLHVYDDHEIANDWDANTTGLYPAAFDPYHHYHLSVNPPLFLSTSVSPADLVTDKSLPTWSIFNQGPASFFVLDTRRYRSSNNHKPDDSNASMLGTAQLVSLLTWLSAPVPEGVHWKVVISSVPFTKNWHVNAQDTWANYLPERQRILEVMWTATTVSGIGIVVLSGDRHEFAATAFPPPPEDHRWSPQATVHEFSASPLNMFYVPVQSYKQMDLEDVCIKYIRDGNSKFGHVSISAPTGSGQSILTYRLFVDGEEAWSHVLVAAGGIDGATRQGRAFTGQRPGAIQWIMDEGRYIQHEFEEAEHYIGDAGERVKRGVKQGEHWVEDSAHAAAHQAHNAEKAALGGLFAGWNWFGRKAHEGSDRARNAAGGARDAVVDEVHHASYRIAHDKSALASTLRDDLSRASSLAAHGTDQAKLSIHKGADQVRSAAGNVKDAVVDEAHHASYRVDHAAHAAASNVKEGVHQASDFASRQAHAGAYTVSSVSRRASAGLKAGEQYLSSRAHDAADAARAAEARAESGVSAAGKAAVAGAVAGEQAFEHAYHAVVNAAKRGEQFVVDEARAATDVAYAAGIKAGRTAVDAAKRGQQYAYAEALAAYRAAQRAGHVASQAGAHIAHDAAHAGRHLAEDAKEAGHHVVHDAQEFGHHVKDDVQYAASEVPPHHRHAAQSPLSAASSAAGSVVDAAKGDWRDSVEGRAKMAERAGEKIQQERRTASDVEDFMRRKGASVTGRVAESVRSADGKEGWRRRRDVEEAVAAGVVGVADMVMEEVV